MPASKPPNNTALIWTLLGLFILAGPSENQLGSQQQAHSQDPPPAPVVEEDDLLEDDLLDDDLLDDDLLDDDLLADEKPSPENPSENTPAHQGSDDNSLEAHALLLAENEFPPAHRCASCHPKQYREWSVSQHAYSQLSPLMLSMQIALNKGTSSTTGDFCVRCHTPVGSDIGEPSSLSNIERHPISREGVTCVVCHRMSAPYRKVMGRLAIDRGDLFDPVKGVQGNAEMMRVLGDPESFQVNTDRDDVGRDIHAEVEKFPELEDPAFCGSCHEVQTPNGFRVHDVLSEYRNSPAAAQGISCNDCHMGKTEGIPSGYQQGPGAVVAAEETSTRKLTNHFFAGPDYSLLHPGVFPINKRAQDLKSIPEWCLFDVESGWGTDEFEDDCPEEFEFPEAWNSIDDRYSAREIIDEQLDLLEWAKQQRIEMMQRGFGLSEIRITSAGEEGIEFEIDVKNLSSGHNLPADKIGRIFVLQVEVTDSRGDLVFISGDRDPNGDVRDGLSLYVRNGEIPLDEQLFNLQSRVLTRNVRGGEREQVLTTNNSISALPFIRPASRPNNVYGHPRGVRKHHRSIEPLGHRTAAYRVAGESLTGTGPYSIKTQFISQSVPVNLIVHTMHVGFDYRLSPRALAKKLVDGAIVIAEKSTVVSIPPR